MNKKSIIIFLIILLLILFVFSNMFMYNNKTEVPKIGKYVCQGEEPLDWSWVILEEEHKFVFTRGLALSYLPVGTYSVEDDKLILSVSENEYYIFSIHEDELIFESSSFDDEVLKKGSVYKLSSEK